MNATEVSTEKLVTDLKRVMQDSEELLADSKDVVGEKAHRMRERLAETIEAAKATCRKLEEKAIAGAKATDKAVHEHPYPAMGVAFGVGLLIGVLVARK